MRSREGDRAEEARGADGGLAVWYPSTNSLRVVKHDALQRSWSLLFNVFSSMIRLSHRWGDEYWRRCKPHRHFARPEPGRPGEHCNFVLA